MSRSITRASTITLPPPEAPGSVRVGRVVHEPRRRNRWCGPAAVSALTGLSTAEAAYLIRSLSGKRAVKGTSKPQMARTLSACGIQRLSIDWWVDDERPTLAAWLRSTHGQRSGKVFLISAGWHWQIVTGNRYICGLTGELVGLHHPEIARRSRVEEVWELVAKGRPMSLTELRAMIPPSQRRRD